MKKHKKTCIVIAILLVLIIVVWYHIPIEKQVSATLYSVDGEVIDVVFDVRWHRYLLAPTELEGTITIGDVVYQSIESKDESLTESIMKKIKNETATPYFVIGSVYDTIVNNKDSVFLLYSQKNSATKNFEKICMVVSKEDNSITYYGPANNAEEAKEISLELGTEE